MYKGAPNSNLARGTEMARSGPGLVESYPSAG